LNDAPVTTSTRSARSTRRRKASSRRNVDDRFCLSSSGSDEHLDYQSEDDYDSDDYLPDPVDDHLFDLEEEEVNAGGEELRTAKTAQASTVVTACRVCSKSDRPEVLLLCDDCDDAYHIECLRPALISVPDGDWFCPLCEHKKLSDQLISKLKDLLVHYHLMDQKRLTRASKQDVPRKIRRKEYSSDESLTASETEEEQLDQHLQEEESMLSASQANENSNLSSSNVDETKKNISQRGRHRRTRFDMNKMLNNHDGSDENSSSGDDPDDEYVETAPQITNFDLQVPKKMTRLLYPRYRPLMRTDSPAKARPIRARVRNCREENCVMTTLFVLAIPCRVRLE
jgi:remodeling and spacing factor 1